MNTTSEFDEIWKRLRFNRFEILLWYIEIEIDKSLHLQKILGKKYLEYQGEMLVYIENARKPKRKIFFDAAADVYNMYFSSDNRQEKVEWLRKSIERLFQEYERNIAEQVRPIKRYARQCIAKTHSQKNVLPAKIY